MPREHNTAVLIGGMPRPQARVWYSPGLSTVYDALRIIRQQDTAGELRLLASHSRPVSPVFAAADESWLEPPASISDAAFIDWCLDTCRARRVDLFVPGRRVKALAGARDRFEAAGTRMMVPATPEAFRRIDRKDWFYADMAGEALPDFRVVRTVAEFDAACAELGALHPRLCVKPVVSIFGLGFHRIVAQDDEYRRFLGADAVPMSMESTRRAIGVAKHPRDLMVMEWLPGPERSVDCIASRGRLLVAVARRKRGDHQVLETAGPAIEAARRVVAHYALDGIVNVQTRDARGAPRLLEANARMSGGLHYACASGVAFPYWAVRLALGLSTPADIPVPRAGVCVAPVQAMVVLGEEADLSRAAAPRTADPVSSAPSAG